MGRCYVIGCNNCITEDEIKYFWDNKNDIKGTYFNINTGGVMLCFCKEQLEKIYGIDKEYNRKNRLLAAGDPPNEIYQLIGTATNNENIDNTIFEKINNNFEFTENLGNYAYYCKYCNKLYSHFYFEMIKENEIYTPKYLCENCSNNLEISEISWEKEDIYDDEDFEEDLKKKNIESFKHIIYLDKSIIKIKSLENDIEEKIICDNCGNSNFLLIGTMFTD